MIRDTIREVEPTAQIILYGSRARGDAREDSDWDVLTIVDKPRLTLQDRSRLQYPVWDKGMDMGEEINVSHTGTGVLCDESIAFGPQKHSFQGSKAMVSESKSIAPGSVLRPPLLQLAQDAPLTARTNVIEPLAVITHPPIRTRLHTF